MNKKILIALDLGTKTGIATFGLDGQLIKHYTFICDKHEQAKDLFNLLRGFLTPNMVVAWERPFGKFGQETMHQMAGAVLCATELVGCDNIPMHLTTVKKFATGSGRAEKADMIEAAKLKWGGEFDEHQADACWVGQCAQETVLGNRKEIINESEVA